MDSDKCEEALGSPIDRSALVAVKTYVEGSDNPDELPIELCFLLYHLTKNGVTSEESTKKVDAFPSELFSEDIFLELFNDLGSVDNLMASFDLMDEYISRAHGEKLLEFF